jgi:hypothetical protein
MVGAGLVATARLRGMEGLQALQKVDDVEAFMEVAAANPTVDESVRNDIWLFAPGYTALIAALLLIRQTRVHRASVAGLTLIAAAFIADQVETNLLRVGLDDPPPTEGLVDSMRFAGAVKWVCFFGALGALLWTTGQRYRNRH